MNKKISVASAFFWCVRGKKLQNTAHNLFVNVSSFKAKFWKTIESAKLQKMEFGDVARLFRCVSNNQFENRNKIKDNRAENDTYPDYFMYKSWNIKKKCPLLRG